MGSEDGMASTAGSRSKGGGVGKEESLMSKGSLTSDPASGKLSSGVPGTPSKGGAPGLQTPIATPVKLHDVTALHDSTILEADPSVTTLPAWQERDVDKAARLERRRQAEERMEEVRREKRAFLEQWCRNLAHELFVDGVVERARILDMGKRSEAAAEQFATDAACFRFRGRYTEADDQDTKGGLMLKDWERTQVPETSELHALRIKAAETGTWVERARKNVRNRFSRGQTKVIPNPGVANDKHTFVGLEYKGGPRVTVEGPSWDEMYVGQLVTLTQEAIRRKVTYDLGDKSGVLIRRARGYTIEKSIEMCKGVIIDSTPDLTLKESDTYQPGMRTTNYIVYPGGGSWVRWDFTKEIDYVWTERLEPCRDGNTPDDIDTRTDMIEKMDWAALDDAVLSLTAQVAFLSNDVVAKLRWKAENARKDAAHRDGKAVMSLGALIKKKKEAPQ